MTERYARSCLLLDPWRSPPTDACPNTPCASLMLRYRDRWERRSQGSMLPSNAAHQTAIAAQRALGMLWKRARSASMLTFL